MARLSAYSKIPDQRPVLRSRLGRCSPASTGRAVSTLRAFLLGELTMRFGYILLVGAATGRCGPIGGADSWMVRWPGSAPFALTLVHLQPPYRHGQLDRRDGWNNRYPAADWNQPQPPLYIAWLLLMLGWMGGRLIGVAAQRIT